MLGIICIDGIEDPIEAQNGIDDRSCIVWPGRFEREIVAQELSRSKGV